MSRMDLPPIRFRHKSTKGLGSIGSLIPGPKGGSADDDNRVDEVHELSQRITRELVERFVLFKERVESA